MTPALPKTTFSAADKLLHICSEKASLCAHTHTHTHTHFTVLLMAFTVAPGVTTVFHFPDSSGFIGGEVSVASD